MAERAVKEKRLPAEMDVRWLASTVICCLEGAALLSRLERTREPLVHAARTLNLVLDGLSRGTR